MPNKRSLLAAVVTASTVLLSIGSPIQAQAGPTEIKMVYWTGPESLAMANVIDAYNAGQGKTDNIQVQMVLFGREGFWERQQTIIAAKSPEVDIFYTASYYLGQQAPALEPLTDHVKNMGKDSIFIPSTLESLSYNGTLYGIPLDVSLHFLYYRSDLLKKLTTDDAWKAKYEQITKDKLGTQMEPKPVEQWTWADFKAAALFFTKSINPDSPTTYGTVLQAKNLVYNIMIWDNVLYSMGGSWFDKSGAPNFNTQPFKDAAQLYADLIKDGATPAESTNYEYPEANQAFEAGQSAFYMQWSAAYPEINGASSAAAGNVGIAPIPGPNPATHVHSLGVALSKYSKNQDAASKFLTYLATLPAVTAYAQGGGEPPVASVLSGMAKQRPEFPTVADHLTKYGYVETTRAETFGILNILANNLSAVWAGQADAASAASKSQADVTKLLGSSAAPTAAATAAK